MTSDQLRSTRDATPFRPFTLRVADGRSFRVQHRDYLLMSPGGRTVIVYQSDEAFSILDLLLVTELLVDPPVAQGTDAAK